MHSVQETRGEPIALLEQSSQENKHAAILHLLSNETGKLDPENKVAHILNKDDSLIVSPR